MYENDDFEIEKYSKIKKSEFENKKKSNLEFIILLAKSEFDREEIALY